MQESGEAASENLQADICYLIIIEGEYSHLGILLLYQFHHES